MTIEKKMEILADVLDMDIGELEPGADLVNLDSWDSLAALSLIVAVNEECGKKLSGEQIKAFVTIQDILDYLG